MLFLQRRKFENLVFIFGAPRSGTTWLWSLLESNKGTIPFLDGIEKNNDGTYDTSESGVYIKDYKNASKKIKLFVSKNKNKIVIEKTPSHTLIYDKILNDFPKSKNIIIFRNPISIVNSMIKSEMTAFQNYDIDYSIKSVKEYYLKLEELSTKEDSIVITYENLLKNTKSFLTSIFERLNLEISKVDQIINDNKYKTRINVKGAYRKGTIDSFKEDLSVSEMKFIEKSLRAEIKLFKRINDLINV